MNGNQNPLLRIRVVDDRSLLLRVHLAGCQSNAGRAVGHPKGKKQNIYIYMYRYMNFGGPTQPFPHTRGFNGCACLYISSKTSSAFGRRQPAGPPKLNKTRQQFSIQQQISPVLREDSPPEKTTGCWRKERIPFCGWGHVLTASFLRALFFSERI